MISEYKIVFFLLIIGIITSCGNNELSTVINDPPDYTFFRTGSSTVSLERSSNILLKSTELVNAMTDNNSSLDLLLGMYTNNNADGGEFNSFSDPALNDSPDRIQSKVAASKDLFSENINESDQIKSDFESWFEAQVSEVFINWTELAAPGQPGQIADGAVARYVNAGGLEYKELVNKGMIGALMVDQIVNNYLSPSVLDEGDSRLLNDQGILVDGEAYTVMEYNWDQAYGYLFGMTEDPTNPLMSSSEDIFLYKYLLRVESDEDFVGIADRVFQAFKLGRAAIVAGDYDTRDKQASVISDALSMIIAVRAIYYLQQGKDNLSSNIGTAFHDLSEGLGFIYSLRFIKKSGESESIFSREEVDEYIDKLTAGNGFWDLTVETLDAISSDIANRFNFTIEQAGS